MKCFHFTNINNIESIKKEGLIPRNGDNSKMIGDEKTKVFFSEGYTGCIALYVDFDIVYNNIKNGIEKPSQEIINKVNKANTLEEYLGNTIYLAFDKEDIFNERNFENGCTDKIITPDKLYVCVLNKTNEKTISQHEIIKYMMIKTPLKEIIYYGAKYENAPSDEAATTRIRSKVEKYYDNHLNDFEEYKNYKLEYIPLTEYFK